MSEEIEIETIPGLPGELPAGERLLWQGRPEWRALAQSTFKLRWLTAYFAVFAAWRVALTPPGQSAVSRLLLPAVLAPACIGILCLIAWLSARSTIYTITTRRVVLRIGVAFPMTWNLPFKRLASADVTVRKEGDGDIVLKVTAPNRVAWLHLWPHAQPGHFANARPSFRAIPSPRRVADLLGNAMREWAANVDAARSLPVGTFSTEPSAAPEALGSADPESPYASGGALVIEHFPAPRRAT